MALFLLPGRRRCRIFKEVQTILIIEDDVMFARMLQNFLQRNGYDVLLAHTGRNARELLKAKPVHLALSDLRLPDVDNLELLRELKSGYDFPVVMMSSHSDIATAVQAMKSGAADYITKPLKPDEVIAIVRNQLDRKTAATRATPPAEMTEKADAFVEGRSEAAARLTHYVELVGPTDFSVLIEGPSGSGKEVIARRIHDKSARKDKPFVAVDCGAIPKELASSEFFGHKKGSFTGALQDKVGYFEQADGGTLFLDEVGNLSYEHQIQLLRALQERRVRPVGAADDVTVDIRIVAATNENLREAIRKGDFREDLFHRLNEFSIVSPSLKEREDDILLFATYFLGKVSTQLGKALHGFSPEALQALRGYHWPGNLRELQNVIKRSALLAQGKEVALIDLPLEILNTEPVAASDAISLKGDEKDRILRALTQAGGNKSKAADLLGISRKTLYNKLDHYGLEDV